MGEVTSQARLEGVALGRLEGFTADGVPLVVLPAVTADRALPARTTVALGPADLGQELAVLLEAGDPARPVVIGRLLPPTPTPIAPTVELRLDGERLLLSAEREIELRCGKASITLTRAGKVLIRGAYVSSRSSGANKIKGASVQLN